jgi:hypothetical protein
MVFIPTFNNISVISWLSVLLVEETGVSRENHWPVASHWRTLPHIMAMVILKLLYHIMLYWVHPAMSGVQIHNLSGDRHWCTCSCKFNYKCIIWSRPWHPLLLLKNTFISGVNNNPSWEHVVFTSSANNNVKLYRKKRLNNWTDGKWRIIIEEIRNIHFNKSQRSNCIVAKFVFIVRDMVFSTTFNNISVILWTGVPIENHQPVANRKKRLNNWTDGKWRIIIEEIRNIHFNKSQ